MDKTCYMCEKAVTSREHVPPKCLFPETKDLPKGFDLRRNLIRVPSCDEHNSQKSLDDEYLLFVLASAIQGNSHKQSHFDTKVMRAVQRKPHVFVSFLPELRPVRLQMTDGRVGESACFKVNLDRFDRAIHHMACGIFYHHYKRKWLGNFRVFTNALLDVTSKNAPDVNKTIQEVGSTISRAFSSSAAFGDNDEIFSYKMYSDELDRHAIHMNFYEGFEITVLLDNVHCAQPKVPEPSVRQKP